MRKTREETTPEMNRFQNHLKIIRESLGWSEAELGQYVGLSRQTINNLENKKNDIKISKTQYIAIRSIINEEIKSSKDDSNLVSVLLEVLVDNPDKYTLEEKNEILKKANVVIPSIVTGNATREIASKEFISLVSSITLGAVATFTASLLTNKYVLNEAGRWLTKQFLKDKKGR